MLVVTCRLNEGIVIIDPSGKVTSIVKVVSTEGGKVRVGTNADASVRILRTKVYERIYGHSPVVGECVAGTINRTPHPAVRMAPVDMDDEVHGDPVGRHD